MGLAMALAACTADDATNSGSPYAGKPVDIAISLDGVAQTRAETAMTTGSAYLISNVTGATMKRYTWSTTENKFTSENQLMWMAPTMTITGYYINGGASRPADDFAYTVSSTTQSYCVGQTTATFGTTESVSIVLKQQLAKVTVTVDSKDGSTLSSPRLGGGVLYMSGNFDNTSFSNNYANGGTDGTGWTVASNGTPTTIDMTQSATSGTSVTYSAIILPQTISNTSVNFFTITAANGGLNHTVSYRLAAAQTFKAGCQYNLKVDAVTNTLYLETDIEIEDFGVPESADMIDNSKVVKVS